MDDMRTTCPSDEELAVLIGGGLTGEDRAHVESHVADCPDCLDVVAATAGVGTRSVAPTLPTGAVMAPPMIGSPVRRASRWRRVAIAAGLAIVATASWLAVAGRPLDRVRPSLARAATRWLGATVRMDGLAMRLGPPGTVIMTFRDVRIGPDPNLFRADEIGFTVSLAALFSDAAAADVRIVGPVIELTQPETLGAIGSAAGRERVVPLLATARRIEVVDGRLIVHGAATTTVEHVTGGIERGDDGTKVVLQGRLGAGTVDLVGTMTDGGRHVALTVAGRDVDAHAIPLVSSRVQGTGDLRVDLTGTGDDLHVAGRVALRQGRIVGRGVGSLREADPMMRSVLAAVPALGGADLAFDDARAVFAWRRGAWRLPRVFVSHAGIVAGGALRIAAGGELHGHGTVRLPAPLTSTGTLAGYRDESGAATVPVVVGGSSDAPRLTLGRP